MDLMPPEELHLFFSRCLSSLLWSGKERKWDHKSSDGKNNHSTISRLKFDESDWTMKILHRGQLLGTVLIMFSYCQENECISSTCQISQSKSLKFPSKRSRATSGKPCLDGLLLTDKCFMGAVNIRKALGTLNLFPVTLWSVICFNYAFRWDYN